MIPRNYFRPEGVNRTFKVQSLSTEDQPQREQHQDHTLILFRSLFHRRREDARDPIYVGIAHKPPC